MEYMLQRTGDRVLKFDGTVLGTTATDPDSAHPDYSGVVGRWFDLTLYATKSGKYVLSHIEYTLWDGMSDHHMADVCDNIAEVYDLLGFGVLAMELYAAANLLPVEHVD